MKKKIRIIREDFVKDGEQYTKYKAITKNWEYIEVRFTKSVWNKPSTTCTIMVDIRDMNIDKHGTKPILWVRCIDNILENIDKEMVNKLAADLSTYLV